jgi:septal ring factor EnvC (AmiA/AmiB activator)
MVIAHGKEHAPSSLHTHRKFATCGQAKEKARAKAKAKIKENPKEKANPKATIASQHSTIRTQHRHKVEAAEKVKAKAVEKAKPEAKVQHNTPHLPRPVSLYQVLAVIPT